MTNIENLLTCREKDVLELLLNGKTNTQIAKELNISTHTVKYYVSSILFKLNVKTRVAAAVVATKYKMEHNVLNKS